MLAQDKCFEVLRTVELLVDHRHRQDAPFAVIEGSQCLRVHDAAAGQLQQRGDDGEIILDAVVALFISSLVFYL